MDRLTQLLLLIPDNQYVTQSQLSEQLNVTNRTIYNDVLKLNKLLINYGTKIISKPRLGLKLEISNLNKYQEFVEKMKTDELLTTDNAEVRMYKIVVYLINSLHSIKMDDLCEELYVSRSTLKNDLKKVRYFIGHYDLHIDHKPYEGMKINGEEKNLRRCLAKVERSQLMQDDNLMSYDLEDIGGILKHVFKNHNFKISEYAFHNLVIHLYIALSRIQLGNILEDNYNYIEHHNEKDYIVAESIITELEDKYEVVFPKNELNYIMIHLSSKKIITEQNNTVVSSDIYEIVISMLKEINNTFHFDFRHDFDLITLLSLHLMLLKIRLIYDLRFENPLKDQIRESYPLAYEMASISSEILYEKYRKRVTSDEMAYIALHFGVAIERQKKTNKKNVLIVCGTGRGTAELLAYQLQEKYSKYINVIKTHESIDFSDIDFKNIDYVLTTVHISETIPVPIIEIKPFLIDEQDIILKDYFKADYKNLILNYFAPELFIPNISLDKKEDILNFMCEFVKQKKNIPDNFHELVLERERIGSTSFGNYIAIPHPYKPIGEESFVAIGVLENPILWDSEMVQIIFLLSMQEGGNEHLQLFYKIVSRLLKNKNLISMLIRNQSYEQLLSIIELLSNN
ncbi:BglG family transcription antiterminator [Anaerosacchariphilus polymeriproducens]|uniref:Transcription antiterminator n=1 Tax=Anaerosacchariphilus polymeriproducens TaxID=1812858 RepID=A0A371ASQ9_9FIRM|nr:BglG family transcription antiterminator [Anaerosacchariphilus polymeriproducens]RDU22500.1 transcription antiterminator [Anaerosacchariphilus polymeriproducens]